MSIHGAKEMARALEKGVGRVKRAATRAVNSTTAYALDTADLLVPQPGGSPFGDHPWATGGLRSHLSTTKAKEEDGVIGGELISDQPEPGTITKWGLPVEEGYGIEWDRSGKAPYMGQTMKQSTPIFKENIDEVIEELG